MLGTVLLLLVVADVGVPGVRVTGAATCPAPAAIERRLAELPGPKAAPEGARTVVVERDAAGAVVLRLGSGGGEARRLPGDLPCDQLAAAAAVTIATWLLASSAEGPAPPIVPPVRAEATPTNVPAVARPAWGPMGDLGVGASASFSPAWAPGVTARASIANDSGRWGMTAFGAWEAPRRIALGEGRVRWWRASGGVGLKRAFGRHGGVGVQLHLEAAAAWIALAGEGFEENHRTGGLSPGATAGVRLLLAGEGRRLAPWIDLAFAAWPLGQRAMTFPTGAQEVVPRLALALTVGVAWLAWPVAPAASS